MPVIPDAVLAGFPKCGTTWLAACLSEHPDICVTEPKEPNYWVRRIDPAHPVHDIPKPSAAEYDACYKQPGARILVDGSVILSDKAEAARRLVDLFGGPRQAIFTVRDPVDRLWSDVCYEYANGRLPRVPTGPGDVPYDLVRRGHYRDTIGRWQDAGWDLLVLDIRRPPAETWRRVTEFLHVDAADRPRRLRQTVRPGRRRVRRRKDRVMRRRPDWWNTHWKAEYETAQRRPLLARGAPDA